MVSVTKIPINLYYSSYSSKNYVTFRSAQPQSNTGRKLKLSDADLKVIKNIESRKDLLLSDKGYAGDVYKYNDLIIKIPKDTPKDVYKRKFPEITYIKEPLGEYSALKYLDRIGVKDMPTPIALLKDAKNKKYIIVESFVDGIHPKPNMAELNIEILRDGLEKFAKLDKNSFYNYDWQDGNLLVKDNQLKFIDLGATCYYADNEQFYTNTVKKAIPDNYTAQKPYKLFTNGFTDNYLNMHRNPNPYFEMFSNADNFEFRTLYYYLKSKGCDNEKNLEFYKDYLKLKSNYHKELSSYIETFDAQKIAQAQKISLEEANILKNNAIKHEKILAELLENPSDEVAKFETLKMQLKYFISEHPEKRSYLKTIFDKTSKLSSEMENTTSESLKTYIKNTCDYIFSYTSAVPRDSVKEPLPAEEDLLRMFEKKPVATQKTLKNSLQKISHKCIAYYHLAKGLLRI